MKTNHKNWQKLSVFILILILITGGNALSQDMKNRNCNCSVCEEFIGSKSIINKSTIISNWTDGPGSNYDADIVSVYMDIFDEIDIPKWKSYVDEVHKQGKLVYTTLRALTHMGKTFEYIMDDPGMQEALVMDVNFNSIRTGWLSDKAFKDIPVRLYCGNHPRFRAFLRHQIYLLSQVGIDGIHVDDFTGSPFSYNLGGCFCDHCMAGFREYLKDKYSAAELDEQGIDDIDSFNYRDVVLKYGDDQNSVRLARNAGEIPLDSEFRFFLFKADADFFASLKEMACQLSGRYIEMGWDNVDFGQNRAMYYDFLDFYFPEICYQRIALDPVVSLRSSSTPDVWEKVKKQKGDEQLPPELIYLYKFADATKKGFIPMPAPPSWSAIKIKGMTGLLRLWIAFTYANGANFKYPDRGWCYAPSSRWYYPPKEEFDPVYNFIGNNRDLFDNYEAVEQIGALYTHASSTRPIRYVGNQLVTLNIPFGTPVAGDDWLVNRIKDDDIDRYEVMLIPEPYKISDGQQQIIDKWKAKKPVISVKEGDDLQKILEGKIDPLQSLESNNKIWMFSRHNPKNEKAPLVCHLVNFDYDAKKNKNNIQRNVQVRLSKKLLGGFGVKNISFYSIDQKPVKVDYNEKGNDIYVTIPDIDLWGVLKVEKNI